MTFVPKISRSRKIYITGEITLDAFKKFSEDMSKLESRSTDLIDLTIASEGGDDYAALAFYDRIRASPCHVYGIATGLVASAASLILVGCHNRRITANSWVMVHETAHVMSQDIRTSQIEKEVAHSRRMEHQWSELFAKHTKTTYDLWVRLNADETYLSAKQCLELGVVDEII